MGDIIKGKYLDFVGSLKFDLRIFPSFNFLLFLALLSVSYLRLQAIEHLLFPGLLLLLMTMLSSSIYTFGQDWFYTILYRMDFAYLPYVAVIFGGALLKR